MKNLFILIALASLFGCKKAADSLSDYNTGQVEISTDESFQSVVHALADGYMISYPKTKVSVKVQREDFGFLDFLKDKAKLIVMSRDLSPAEVAAVEKRTQSKFLPAKFAADAVVFVVPAGSAVASVSMEEIREGLTGKGAPRFIFDGTNAGNLNFVAQKLGKKPSDLNFSIINGNENIIKELNKFPGKIGVIGLNTISRPYDPVAQNLRTLVKVLPVATSGGAFAPEPDNLKTMKYPFTRILYFLTSEGNFNIANGFIRYACTQLGEMIVEKEGLQPYNVYKREVQMH